MTKKDYIKLDDALVRAKPYVFEPLTTGDMWKLVTWSKCVGEIAEALTLDNPNFNKDIFIKHVTE